MVEGNFNIVFDAPGSLKQFVEQFRIMVHQYLERGLAVQKQLSS